MNPEKRKFFWAMRFLILVTISTSLAAAASWPDVTSDYLPPFSFVPGQLTLAFMQKDWNGMI